MSSPHPSDVEERDEVRGGEMTGAEAEVMEGAPDSEASCRPKGWRLVSARQSAWPWGERRPLLPWARLERPVQLSLQVVRESVLSSS